MNDESMNPFPQPEPEGSGLVARADVVGAFVRGFFRGAAAAMAIGGMLGVAVKESEMAIACAVVALACAVVSKVWE